MMGDRYKVHELRNLTGKPRQQEALALLQEASRQVQPIMRKRKWTVPLVSEFYPRNANLLGLNIGGHDGRTTEIKIRLRPAGREEELYPYEHILGTMLHELTHNVCGPHNAAFYKLLEEITQECEELMAKGISGSGQGFDAPSTGRLGSHSFIPTHNPPPARLREVALRAAEERAKKQRLMPGVRRLGGDTSTMRDLPPAAAAARAAERRAADNKWCPGELLATQRPEGMDAAVRNIEDGGPPATSASSSGDSGPGAAAQRQASSANSAWHAAAAPASATAAATAAAALPNPTATAAPAPAHFPPAAGPASTLPTPAAAAAAARVLGTYSRGQPQSSTPGPTARTHEVLDLTGSDDEDSDAQGPTGAKARGGRVRLSRRWTCPCCTLLNVEEEPQCGACEGPRPAAGGGGGAAAASGGGLIEVEAPAVASTSTLPPAGAGAGAGACVAGAASSDRRWTCRICTLQNQEAESHCTACSTWRFSSGAPVATLAGGAWS